MIKIEVSFRNNVWRWRSLTLPCKGYMHETFGILDLGYLYYRYTLVENTVKYTV